MYQSVCFNSGMICSRCEFASCQVRSNFPRSLLAHPIFIKSKLDMTLCGLGGARYPTMHSTSASGNTSNEGKCVLQSTANQVCTPQAHNRERRRATCYSSCGSHTSTEDPQSNLSEVLQMSADLTEAAQARSSRSRAFDAWRTFESPDGGKG